MRTKQEAKRQEKIIMNNRKIMNITPKNNIALKFLNKCIINYKGPKL